MQTNKGKAFRCLHYHLGWVLIPLLAESLLSCNVYLSDLLLIYQSGPIWSCDQLTGRGLQSQKHDSYSWSI